MSIFTRKNESAAGTALAESAPDRDLSHLTGDYTIDPAHSRIGFSVRHAMVTNVRGEFTAYEGALHLDGANPAASSAELVIKVASIDTHQAQRDEHLRTGDSSPPRPTRRSPSGPPRPRRSTATPTGCTAT